MTTDPLDEIEPFTEIQLSTATTLDDQFLEFLGSGNYCWNHNSHMDLKPASYRKYRGAGVSIAWEYHDDTRNNFGIWIEGEKPYFSKNYQDARLCSAAAFAKVMLLTGADRDEVVAWWNKRKGIEESHKESI